MAAMDDERDDWAADGDVADHRDRAAAELNQVTRQVKLALIEREIDMPIFFLVPNNGRSILTFGTPGDPNATEGWSELCAQCFQLITRT